MKAKEFETKPRNFVAKNAKMGGAGQHKDKKKAEKQGDVKHKQKLVPMETIEQKLARKIQENLEQGVAEGSEPQVGDAVYYRNRLLGWFVGYGNNDKVIVQPNEDEGHDSNNPIYIDKSAVTIKPNQQGVADK